MPPTATDGPNADTFEDAIAILATGTPREQKVARDQLLDAGAPALTALTAAFAGGPPDLQYEVLRIVAEIGSDASAELLVSALAMEDEDLQFVAAEGLTGLEAAGLEALLGALANAAPAPGVLGAAADILVQFAYTPLGPAVAPVLEALATPGNGAPLRESARGAAEALRAWRSEAA